MLSSKQKLESERLSSQVGERRPTHFRQQIAALEGPTPENYRHRRGKRNSAGSGASESVTMRVGFRRQPNSDEEFLTQEIL
jgi:hypothetical protein